MNINKLEDGSELFDVSVRKGKDYAPEVLFAVGAGGNPERHVTLLDALVEAGCTVIAPHFPRLASPRPTEAELTTRARRLCLALDAFGQSGATVSGVGHSIGAATLIALAGGQMWLGPGQRVDISADARLSRLALLAPPTGFFKAPGALDSVRVPILTWVGSEDNIIPPSQIRWLARAMPNSQNLDVRVTDGAGHFSFMDQIPPHVVEPLKDKQSFLREYSSEVCEFVCG
ncbi:hypothetical protein MIT9_P1712 [Methylomarinovum caldicuralii]|uniref:Alpha/beta hydrolase n=1 Tax=Methylomarinovum caldicuralii TaxID=438856 RepID=A0AAU9C1C2_9GAMM|nr:hypothetical protein [Methylomarinovum caldicuralii]BCX82127.1 hypothetical protein MIT9_P1712 [Methylomarinovum caldicuralii]